MGARQSIVNRPLPEADFFGIPREQWCGEAGKKRAQSRCQRAGGCRRAVTWTRQADNATTRPLVAANDPGTIEARRRYPADRAGSGPAPGETAPGRIDGHGLPSFNCVGVELRNFSLQRGDPPFEANPAAPSLRLSAQSRYKNCGCASEQHCKNTHLRPLFGTISIAPDQSRNSRRARSTVRWRNGIGMVGSEQKGLGVGGDIEALSSAGVPLASKMWKVAKGFIVYISISA